MFLTNFIFDLDGTLIDSKEEIISCLDGAYEQILPERHIKCDKSLIGPPLKEMILKLTPDISEDKMAKIIKLYRNSYDNSCFDLTKPYDGVHELLSLLKKKNAKLFLVTNKPTIPTQRILTRNNLTCFDEILSPDSTPNVKSKSKPQMIASLVLKYNLTKNNSIVIGDSELDYEAASQNNLDSIITTQGYGDKEKIHACHPKIILNHINELLNILESLEIIET